MPDIHRDRARAGNEPSGVKVPWWYYLGELLAFSILVASIVYWYAK